MAQACACLRSKPTAFQKLTKSETWEQEGERKLLGGKIAVQHRDIKHKKFKTGTTDSRNEMLQALSTKGHVNMIEFLAV